MGEKVSTWFVQVSLAKKRALLVLLILVQASLLIGHLLYQRGYVEDNAARILRNTAILQSQQFDTSLNAMRYQMRFIGNAFLLNHTVTPENAQPFLQGELKRAWLDGVIVFDEDGDFLSSRALFPFERALDASTLAQASFRQHPLFTDFRRDEVTESLFYWQSNGTDKNMLGFVMFRAVRDAHGRFLGGALGFFNGNTMNDMFRKMEVQGFDLGQGGAMAVLDRDNAVQLARMGANGGSQLNTSDPRLAKLLEYASDTAQVHRYTSPIDGVERMGVFLNLNERKWGLAVGLARKDVLHGWYYQALWTALAILVISITQWFLMHYIHVNALQRARFQQEARLDPLTGLANRRQFDEWSLRACNLARRHQQPLCLMSMDLDFFKRINDTWGHDGGDAVLKHIGNALPALVRGSDIVARFGGEEFVVAMPQTSLETAAEIAERVRMSLASQNVDFNGQTIRFTASMGLVCMTPDELEIEHGVQSALARADRELYRAKREGRNRVCVAS